MFDNISGAASAAIFIMNEILYFSCSFNMGISYTPIFLSFCISYTSISLSLIWVYLTLPSFFLSDSYLRAMRQKFYGRYLDLIGKYQRLVKDMVADSFPDYFNAVVQLVLGLSLFFKLYC